MGILDEAIREHLQLKRKHGAREAEIREIEDEALGSGDEPDPFAASNELFGEVSTSGTPEVGTAESPHPVGEVSGPDIGGDEPTRMVESEALVREPEAPPEPEAYPTPEPEDVAQIPGQVELPGQDEVPGQERLDQPLEDQRPAEPLEDFGPPAEPEPPSPSGSLEELIAEEEPFPEDSAAPSPDAGVEQGPSADRGGALEATELEPHEEGDVSVPEPPPPPPPGPEPPGRARGRLDVPTEEHPPPGETGDAPAAPAPEPEVTPEPEPEAEAHEPAPPASDAPELYDFETDDEPLASEPPTVEPRDEFEALGPAEEEAPYRDEEEPFAEEPPSGTEAALDMEPPLDEPGTEVRPATADEEDDTDEGLWFEKGPPKDFDFD
jgi:hypothetical protein